jgi:N-acetylmuramoyl-L-alanine amidase
MKTMAKLCFDYGHGGSDSGACYNGRKDSMDVLNIGREVAAEVRRHGVTVDGICYTRRLRAFDNYIYFYNSKDYRRNLTASVQVELRLLNLLYCLLDGVQFTCC